jgi:hypothetical protein
VLGHRLDEIAPAPFYVGSVAGPIVIGWLAEATILRTALGLVVALVAVSGRGCDVSSTGRFGGTRAPPARGGESRG